MQPTLVSYGGRGKSYWGQVQCSKCSAWLKEMPDRYEFRKSDLENIDEFYHYFWKCLACGYEREVEELSTPDCFQPNPDADIKEPGTIPDPIEENPDKWKNATELSPIQKELVRECWKMINSLAGVLTIHKVTYIWHIHDALAKQDINAVIKTVKEYVDLLNYEAIHGVDSGSYCGVEGDITEISRILSSIGRKQANTGSDIAMIFG